jgi:hypothetical protein
VKPKITPEEVLKEQLLELKPEELLERFLKASSLEERRLMILSASTPEELAISCLAKPLPQVTKMQLDFRENKPDGGGMDCYFNVDFEGKSGELGPQWMVVRTRPDQGSKVLVDPFLDGFGGRLASYAMEVRPEPQIFQVMVVASAGCKDLSVPLYQDKLTLKLLDEDQGSPIAKAYCSKNSSIAHLLEDGTFRLSYGNPTVCRVLLRWNQTESAESPYLEAVEIKGFGWEP